MSIKLKTGFVIDAKGRLLGPGSNLDQLSGDLLQSLIAAGRTEGAAPTKAKTVEVDAVDAVDEVDVLADIDTSDVLDELPEVDVEEAVEAAPAKPKTSSRKSSNKSK